MRFSKFNIMRQMGEDLVIYNTLSGGVLHLEPKYAKNFNEMYHSNDISNGVPELIQNLKQGYMIVEDDFDEKTFIISQNNQARFNSKMYSLTVAPTMKCNFECPYCYEENKDYASMDNRTVQKLIERLKEIRSCYEYLGITWYGGEPLLGIETIKTITKAAIELFGEDKYFGNIITNGYLLTKDIAMSLKSLNINMMQVTIDGPPDIHNTRRKLHSGEDTFFVILNNVKEALKVNESLRINVRVNTDKENVGRIDKILDYLVQYDLKDKVNLYLAAVDNINGSYCNASSCFSNNEFAREQMSFINRNLEKGFNFAYLPQTNFSICCAVAPNADVIDSRGNTYKCWNDISKKECSTGNIFENKGLPDYNTTKWLAYSIADDDECMECKLLPLCMGGCPSYRLTNNKHKCIALKENVNDMIDVYYKIECLKRCK